jgi:hypothetical protein
MWAQYSITEGQELGLGVTLGALLVLLSVDRLIESHVAKGPITSLSAWDSVVAVADRLGFHWVMSLQVWVCNRLVP